MQFDPYGLCPCGSGKKLKWCCAKILPQIDKALQMARDKQFPYSLRILDELIAQNVNTPYVQAVRAQVYLMSGQEQQAHELIEQTIIDHPSSAFARETRANFLLLEEDYAEALDGYTDALVHYAVDAKDQRTRTLTKMGSCHMAQGRPIAAWAAWQMALRIDPTFQAANEAMDQSITKNFLLPNAVRQGLRFKSPDEFASFNEGRELKWQQANQRQGEWFLDDVIMLFDDLAHEDEFDTAAWYNLALVYAFNGENAKALEALEQYVKHEDDFEESANAWEIGEVLRLGVGAEEFSDLLHYVADYELVNPQPFFEALKACKNLLIVSGADGSASLHWMDRESQTSESLVPLVGGLPRQLAQINIKPNEVEIVASSAANLDRVRADFERVAGDTVRHVGEYQRPGELSTLDAEPFLVLKLAHTTDEEHERALRRSVEQYFEEEWIRRPLRSLNGLTPIDAAGSSELKRRLEGVVRFRERSFHRYEFPYNFDRLRNKLGLATLPKESVDNDISAYSVAQLGSLTPGSLSDSDLLVAYRTATALDAAKTALQFGREIVRRDSLAKQTDVAAVFRRLIAEATDTGRRDEALAILDEALAYDDRNYDGEHRTSFQATRAGILLSNRQTEQATALYNEVFERDPDNLPVLAEAAERMLSAGLYEKALEYAERGLKRAEALRKGDFQSQFREYCEAAGSRV